jgi:glycine/D-amino acid oxidase-like deaminating enzyme
MPSITIIGCGIVGATIAYEFSQLPDWKVVVIDRQSQPAQESTGAALGLLMAVISQKTKGRAWQLRQEGISYYHRLIPHLAAAGLPVNHNAQGMLKLLAVDDDLSKWQSLTQIRANQGWPLEIWDREQVIRCLPHINPDSYSGAIHSPADWQIHPPQLTCALVTAAQRQGAHFHWETAITTMHDLTTDWVVIAAGVGSMVISQSLNSSDSNIKLMPVLGQAIHYRSPKTLGMADFQPVVTSDDVHIVPLGGGEYWVGATVEFPIGDAIEAQPEQLAMIQAKAIGYCPALAQAEIVKTWQGLRPRPVGRPAPIIEHLPGHERVLVATGHYRNGVLLAPATANLIKEMVGVKKAPHHGET